MAKNRLSYSAVSKYQDCPKSYEFHYIKKLRSKYQGSALFFGSAIDNSIGVMLDGHPEKAEAAFLNSWSEAEHNKKRVKLESYELITYSNSEFDADLLPKGHDIDLAYMKDLLDKKKAIGFENMELDEQKYFNRANWLCLKEKGLLMVRTFRDEVMPRITKVHATQKRVDIENDEGDTIVGYVDLIADWEDGSTVVFDLKTSSIQYENDSVVTSAQLASYVYAVENEYNTRKAGYIVLRKQVNKNKEKVCSVCGFEAEKGSTHKTCYNTIGKKRCGGEWDVTIRPTVDVQIIIDTVPEQTEAIVMENYNDVNTMIKHGIYTRNLNACKKPWGLCPYFNLCWVGKDDNLLNMEET
jgi:hypothetical protein